MNVEEARKFVKKTNAFYYFIIRHFHRELMGHSRPCNILELMKLVGSEKQDPDFQKVEIDDKYISHIPFKRFDILYPMQLTEDMINGYPWIELAKSIEEEGFKVPLIVMYDGRNMETVVTLEGKHRIAAFTLIEPFDLEKLIPCIVVDVDPIHTQRMYKKRHKNPFLECGYSEYYDK